MGRAAAPRWRGAPASGHRWSCAVSDGGGRFTTGQGKEHFVKTRASHRELGKPDATGDQNGKGFVRLGRAACDNRKRRILDVPLRGTAEARLQQACRFVKALGFSKRDV